MAVFGFVSEQDLTKYQHFLLSAHLLLYAEVLIRADLYNRLTESPLEGGSKYGVDRTHSLCCIFCTFLIPNIIKISNTFFLKKEKIIIYFSKVILFLFVLNQHFLLDFTS